MIELGLCENTVSKLLPLYTFDAETGEWEHGADDFGKRGRRWIETVDRSFFLQTYKVPYKGLNN